jgi:hypothetical protein
MRSSPIAASACTTCGGTVWHNRPDQKSRFSDRRPGDDIDDFRQLEADTTKPPTGGLSRNQYFATSRKSGAGEGIRTLDPDLGKVVLYH